MAKTYAIELTPHWLSLGDVINLGLDFDLYRDRINFKQLFPSQFEAEFLLVTTKLIKSVTNIIEKFQFDQKRSKRDRKRQFI